MMDRRKIAAGNWKMHTLLNEGLVLAAQLAENWDDDRVGMIVAPPLTHLDGVLHILRNSRIGVAAQNCYCEPYGAFTGDVSPVMLRDMGVTHVIIGHSERREIFGESDDLLRDKVNAALDSGLEVIFCCGEPLQIREAEAQADYVRGQLERSLFHLGPAYMEQVMIAYEPIWAIGTGRTATPEQAQEMHQFIRGLLRQHYRAELADSTSILYGGSVKPGNASDLFAGQDVDGGLVGGASLKADDFMAIARALVSTNTM